MAVDLDTHMHLSVPDRPWPAGDLQAAERPVAGPKIGIQAGR